MALDPVFAARLIKLLGMTGSDYDGEAVAAVRKANALLQAQGLTWSDVIAVVESAPKKGAWREPESWRDAVCVCLGLADSPLSQWDICFLHGISRRHSLSEKQTVQLDRIVASCRFHARMAA